jgi:fluoride exporter
LTLRSAPIRKNNLAGAYNSQMLAYLFVAVGGAIGSVARFWISGALATRFESFPVGTLVVNVSGSFLIGVLASLGMSAGRVAISPGARQFLMIGVCGGYTTFSSFSLQTFELAQQGQWQRALLNSALSFGCCMLAVWLGYVIGAALNSAKNS